MTPSLKISEDAACFPDMLNCFFFVLFTVLDLIPCVWPVTINDRLKAPSHTRYYVSGSSKGYGCPFLNLHGSKLLDGSQLQLTS
jgi:hypothetical protein